MKLIEDLFDDIEHGDDPERAYLAGGEEILSTHGGFVKFVPAVVTRNEGKTLYVEPSKIKEGYGGTTFFIDGEVLNKYLKAWGRGVKEIIVEDSGDKHHEYVLGLKHLSKIGTPLTFIAETINIDNDFDAISKAKHNFKALNDYSGHIYVRDPFRIKNCAFDSQKLYTGNDCSIQHAFDKCDLINKYICLDVAKYDAEELEKIWNGNLLISDTIHFNLKNGNKTAIQITVRAFKTPKDKKITKYLISKSDSLLSFYAEGSFWGSTQVKPKLTKDGYYIFRKTKRV